MTSKQSWKGLRYRQPPCRKLAHAVPGCVSTQPATEQMPGAHTTPHAQSVILARSYKNTSPTLRLGAGAPRGAPRRGSAGPYRDRRPGSAARVELRAEREHAERGGTAADGAELPETETLGGGRRCVELRRCGRRAGSGRVRPEAGRDAGNGRKEGPDRLQATETTDEPGVRGTSGGCHHWGEVGRRLRLLQVGYTPLVVQDVLEMCAARCGSRICQGMS